MHLANLLFLRPSTHCVDPVTLDYLSVTTSRSSGPLTSQAESPSPMDAHILLFGFFLTMPHSPLTTSSNLRALTLHSDLVPCAYPCVAWRGRWSALPGGSAFLHTSPSLPESDTLSLLPWFLLFFRVDASLHHLKNSGLDSQKGMFTSLRWCLTS